MVFDAATWGMCAVSGLTLAVHAWTLKRWARGWKLAAKAIASVEAPAQADFGIVIPCRNEEDRLPHLLDDLVAALRTHPALSQLPVVVVDDWSDDQPHPWPTVTRSNRTWCPCKTTRPRPTKGARKRRCSQGSTSSTPRGP